MTRLTATRRGGRDDEFRTIRHAARNYLELSSKLIDLSGRLRYELADASKSNSVLSRAIAIAAGVSADTDLVTAAKTTAVIETLYEMATGNSKQILDASDVVFGGSSENLAMIGRTAEEIDRIMELRTRHADLRKLVEGGKISPRDVCNGLAKHYV